MENLPKEKNHIWKIRTVKNYSDASNHIIIGKVISCNTTFIRLHCRTYHFRKHAHSPNDFRVGEPMTRIIPWSRVEIVNELDQNFNYINSELISDDDNVVLLTDNKIKYTMQSVYEKSF